MKSIRTSLHPWVWVAVVKPAVVNHTQKEMSVSTRRKAFDFMKELDACIDPDTMHASPYARLSAGEIKRRTDRNNEILTKDPVYGKFTEDKVVGGQQLMGYRPLPDPSARVAMSLYPGVHEFVLEAVETFATRKDITHLMSGGIVDAIDALRASSNRAKESAEVEETTGGGEE